MKIPGILVLVIPVLLWLLYTEPQTRSEDPTLACPEIIKMQRKQEDAQNFPTFLHLKPLCPHTPETNPIETHEVSETRTFLFKWSWPEFKESLDNVLKAFDVIFGAVLCRAKLDSMILVGHF